MNNVCLQKLMGLKEIKQYVFAVRTMGNGLQNCRQAGYGIIQFDIKCQHFAANEKTISNNLDKLLLKEKITTEEKYSFANRLFLLINFISVMADVIIETI